MFSQYVHGGGPIVKGPLFPFVFVTIACGAISGFHALIGSGTTPKMLDNERDARVIGYGAMLMEGLGGLTALIAAARLPLADYSAINTDPPVAVIAGFPSRAPDGRRTAPGTGIVRHLGEALAVDRALGPEDRRRLGLRQGQTVAQLAGRTVPLSVALS